jgi:hypothetical protein
MPALEPQDRNSRGLCVNSGSQELFVAKTAETDP